MYGKYSEQYKETYKKHVIENLVKTIHPSLKYENIINNKLEQHYRSLEYRNPNSRLVEGRFLSNDYISGLVDEKLIELSDVYLQYACVFAHCTLNRGISHEIKIRNSKNSSILNKRMLNTVQIDSTEFEKYFDVFSDSKITALEILTHDVMEEIMKFYNNSPINFEITIREDNIYIRYDIGDIFEVELFKKSTSKKMLWCYYIALKFAVNLTLKINKILESKEDIL